MKLMTKEIEARFADIGDQSNELDPIVVAKFFLPWEDTVWLAFEYNKADNNCFGCVKSLVEGKWNNEWSTFSIDELETVKGATGLGIERDIHFSEKPLSIAIGKEYLECNFPRSTKQLKEIKEEQIKSEPLNEEELEKIELQMEEEYLDRLEEIKILREQAQNLDDDLER